TSGRHPFRERLKAALGRSPADREARRLARLHAAGVPVPPPLGRGVLPGGDRILVLPWIEGEPLAALLAGPPAPRRRALAALGRAVARLHAAGFAHGDLHAENLLFAGGDPVLLDLQHARRRAGEAARLRDLGALDYSLRDRAALSDRLRLRAAALGLRRPFDAAARARLRAVGRAARRRARAHGRSRTRRRMRPGRLVASLRLPAGAGLRWRDFPEAVAAGALRAHDAVLAGPPDAASDPESEARPSPGGGAAVLQAGPRGAVTRVRVDGRGLVVKEGRAGGLARALADRLRGSAARRGWRGGHGLLAREVPAARPLAFVEQRRLGLPVRSWLVLEDLAPAPDALAAAAAAPGATLDALTDLLHRLHRRDVDHGDLKATHVFLVGGRGAQDVAGARAVLVDLEHVRFPRRLRASRRRRALAELNASLPDAVPADARRAAFLRYAARHPFAEGRTEALRRVVRESLARRHRWTGAGCACAGAEAAAGAGRLTPSSG
ncbi:MAG: lipopolysaccharide kinase InaA family protein, partial [Myxococcota bacterium]|nr:lipopolysaccharide kinase InaA family protein [Myxococcota bacterium]